MSGVNAGNDQERPGLRDFPVVVRIEPRLRDLDVQGHVNQAVYFTYFEIARTRFMTQVVGAEPVPPGFVLASASCEYRSEAKLGDKLLVGVRVPRVGRTSFDMEFRVETATGRLVAEGRCVQVCTGADGPVPVPEAWRRAMLGQPIS